MKNNSLVCNVDRQKKTKFDAIRRSRKMTLLKNCILLIGLLTLPLPVRCFQYQNYSFVREELQAYRDQTSELFHWSLDQYMEHAYPFDELNPIECCPKGRNFEDPYDTVANDVLGNFSLSLIDSLTTLIVLEDRHRFTETVRLITDVLDPHWQIDSTVQTFETVIRIIGSFLSAHIYIVDQDFWDPLASWQYHDLQYDLLDRAAHLADIILETYRTKSMLPYPRTNLMHGIEKVLRETPELMTSNNPVAMGCPFFEFHLLSILTNDDKYRVVSQHAYNTVIRDLQSELSLIPHSVNVQNLDFLDPYTNVGASIDSIYEYSLKNAILFNNNTSMNNFQQLMKPINVYSEDFWFYKTVDVHNTGNIVSFWIDSLSAFFPGLLVLNGEIENATYKNQLYWKLWNYYGGIPERWNFKSFLPSWETASTATTPTKETQLDNIIELEWYPLRPEMIESCYYLYQATRDPMYLNIGKQVLNDLQTRFKCECGLCGIQNVKTGERQHRMESFVLSETLKYLYLLFSHDFNPSKYNNVIFNTEAHPFYIPKQIYRKYLSNRFFNDSYFSGIPEYQQVWQDSLSDNIYTNPGGNGTCLISKKFMNRFSGKSTFMYSSILNDSLNLFEFDRLFQQQLVYPDWLIKERNCSSFQMELNPGFNAIYNSASKLQCQLSSNLLVTGDSYISGDSSPSIDVVGHSLQAIFGSHRQFSITNNQQGPNVFNSLLGCSMYIITEGNHLTEETTEENPFSKSFLVRVDDSKYEPHEIIYVKKNPMMANNPIKYDRSYYAEIESKLKKYNKKWSLKSVLRELSNLQKIVSTNNKGQLIIDNRILLQNVYLI